MLLSGTAYVVNSLADVVASDGVVTLREALEAANTNTAVTADVAAGSSAETDTITFDQAALQAQVGLGNPLVITLAGSELQITDNVDMVGLGVGVLTIDAAGKSRVVEITNAVTGAEISDLTITGGGSTPYGGGILNAGTISLVNVSVRGNTVSGSSPAKVVYGGGIDNGGTMSLTHVTVSGNTVESDSSSYYGSGGGINSGGRMTLTDVTVSGNTVNANYPSGGAFSGGIENHSSMTLIGVTVSGNAVNGSWAAGGGIGNDFGSMTLTNVTISGNTAHGTADSGAAGGGIDNGGNMLLTNVTVADNTVTVTSSSGAGYGGGIRNSSALAMTNTMVMGNTVSAPLGFGGGLDSNAAMTLTKCVVSENTASGEGGGIYGYNSGGLVILTNVAVSANTAQQGGGIYCDDTRMTMTNCTISLNIASGSAGTPSSGGGIENSTGTISLMDCTVAGNVASGSSDPAADFAGGIANDSGTATLTNSIVALNSAVVNPDLAGSWSGSSDLVGGNPGFIRDPSPGPDGVWGTGDDDPGNLKLAIGSPAIDVGDNNDLPPDAADLNGNGNTVEPLPLDLAGNPRVYGASVDVGAYEFQGLSVVVGVYVRGTGWTSQFLNGLTAMGNDPVFGYRVPSGSSAQFNSLPWSDIDEISITFSQAINVTEASLTLTGVDGGSYSFSNFAYDSTAHVATWRFSTPIDTDSLQLDLASSGANAVADLTGRALDGEWTDGVSTVSGDGTPGGGFLFHFNVLPGDLNGDGVVNGQDFDILSSSFGQINTGGDLNGDGVTGFADFAILSNDFGTTLPVIPSAFAADSTILTSETADAAPAPTESSGPAATTLQIARMGTISVTALTVAAASLRFADKNTVPMTLLQPSRPFTLLESHTEDTKSPVAQATGATITVQPAAQPRQAPASGYHNGWHLVATLPSTPLSLLDTDTV